MSPGQITTPFDDDAGRSDTPQPPPQESSELPQTESSDQPQDDGAETAEKQHLTAGKSGLRPGRGGARSLDPRPGARRDFPLCLDDALTQKGLRVDVESIREIIAKGSNRERLEAFRLLYGAPGDPRRGPEGKQKPPRRPGIVLPEA